MHPLLKDLSIFSWHHILDTEEKAVKFLEEIGLIPSCSPCPPCPLCKGPMHDIKIKNYKIGWIWRCKNRFKTQCHGYIFPLKNTLLFNLKIPVMDILAMIFGFIVEIPVTKLGKSMNAWRRRRGEKLISKATLDDVYNFCKEIVEIVSSHYIEQLGKPGKIICLEESHFVSRKRRCNKKINYEDKKSLFVFSKEDKEGLILLVNKNEPQHAWPNIVKPHSKQGTIVNYNREEFPPKSVENFRTAEMQRRKAMLFSFYRRVRLVGPSEGEMFQQFLEDVGRVYPGYGTKGLTVLQLDENTTKADVLAQSAPQQRHLEILNNEIQLDAQLDNNSDGNMPLPTVDQHNNEIIDDMLVEISNNGDLNWCAPVELCSPILGTETPLAPPLSSSTNDSTPVTTMVTDIVPEAKTTVTPTVVLARPCVAAEPLSQTQHYEVPAVPAFPRVTVQSASQNQQLSGTVFHTVRLNRNFNRILSVTTVAASNQPQPQSILAPKKRPRLAVKLKDNKLKT